jgi:hypothetical protein
MAGKSIGFDFEDMLPGRGREAEFIQGRKWDDHPGLDHETCGCNQS